MIVGMLWELSVKASSDADSPSQPHPPGRHHTNVHEEKGERRNISEHPNIIIKKDKKKVNYVCVLLRMASAISNSRETSGNKP